MSRDLSIHPQSVASPPTSPSPSVPARRSLLGHSSAPGALVDDARADTARALRRALRRAGAADARGAVAVAETTRAGALAGTTCAAPVSLARADARREDVRSGRASVRSNLASVLDIIRDARRRVRGGRRARAEF